MSTVGVRRRPNAFNIVWQLELLVRSGVSEQNAITSLEAMASILNLMNSQKHNLCQRTNLVNRKSFGVQMCVAWSDL